MLWLSQISQESLELLATKPDQGNDSYDLFVGWLGLETQSAIVVRVCDRETMVQNLPHLQRTFLRTMGTC